MVYRKKRTCKALGALVAALVLLNAAAPLALAAGEPKPGDIPKSKTATALGSDRYTITLSLPDTQEEPVYDIVFVLDKNTAKDALLNEDLCVLMKDLADGLAAYPSGKLNVGIVSFSTYTAVQGKANPAALAGNFATSVNDLDIRAYYTAHALTEFDGAYYDFLKGTPAPNDDLYDKWATEYGYADWMLSGGQPIFRAFPSPVGLWSVGGTNIQAGIRAARQMLAAETTASADHKLIVLATDGGSYLWVDEDDKPQLKVKTGTGNGSSNVAGYDNALASGMNQAGASDNLGYIGSNSIFHTTYSGGSSPTAAAFAAFIDGESSGIEAASDEKMSIEEYYQTWETANAAFDASGSAAGYAVFKRQSGVSYEKTLGSGEKVRWPYHGEWYRSGSFITDYPYTQAEVGIYYAAKELQAAVEGDGYRLATLGFNYNTSPIKDIAHAFLEWTGELGTYVNLNNSISGAMGNPATAGQGSQFFQAAIGNLVEGGTITDVIGTNFELEAFDPASITLAFNGVTLAGVGTPSVNPTSIAFDDTTDATTAEDFVLSWDGDKTLTLDIDPAISITPSSQFSLSYTVKHTKSAAAGQHKDYTNQEAYLDYVRPADGVSATEYFERPFVEYTIGGRSGGSGSNWTPPSSIVPPIAVLPPKTGDHGAAGAVLAVLARWALRCYAGARLGNQGNNQDRTTELLNEISKKRAPYGALFYWLMLKSAINP
ncbi:MAG: hypothetical protein LBN26_00930 [Christensenellaceae bacterium]|jgi:hypothetical protein|nr:hypothetical protein [Christensenellaceae bacterium]